MDYKLSKEEQETIVNYSEDGKEAQIYTASPIVMRKLDKLCEKYPNYYSLTAQDKYSKTYQTTKKMIAFKKPSTYKMPDELREKAKERMKLLQSKLKSANQ